MLRSGRLPLRIPVVEGMAKKPPLKTALDWAELTTSRARWRVVGICALALNVFALAAGLGLLAR